jgi:DNA polymerase I
LRFEQVDALPYERIIALDFEFFGVEGENPNVVCLVTRDLLSGELRRYWHDDFVGMESPPFDTGETTLLLAYFASAEMQCFKALGWEKPECLVDLYVEFRRLTNGQELSHGRGMVGALLYFGLDRFIPSEKVEMRELILSGGPWSKHEVSLILDYCQQDVDALGPLFAAILANDPWNIDHLGQALIRGRYMAAVGSIQFYGIPIDVQTLEQLQRNWPVLQQGLIARVDKAYGVYNEGSFKEALFTKYLDREGIAWPRSDTGRLKMDRDTFSDMSKRHPQIRELHELRKTMAELRTSNLSVGPDGRNRTLLSPFSSKTGRNQPSTSKFIYGAPKWVRSLIKPEEDFAVAYVDWSSQEIAIAAALSGDTRLWEAYTSGDPYMAFAIQAGLAPPNATKATHKEVRDRCKQVVLGTNYGMSASGIAQTAGIHELEAKNLLQKHQETYHVFWEWAEQNKDRGLLGLPLTTCYGWKIQATSGPVKANTFLNWPMQAHGAEMMRLACCSAIGRGIRVCAPVHDALLIEAPSEAIDTAVEELRDCMAQASEWVLGEGKVCRTDVEIVRFPDRYEDEGGRAMWRIVVELLAQIEG